ncbi:MAG: hypothetical protein HY517_03785 [Candidatus Aenigmarchaeota archaeon]|nr:hypothetical protein [Candidatus Aenigmarchaeota archaeon]
MASAAEPRSVRPIKPDIALFGAVDALGEVREGQLLHYFPEIKAQDFWAAAEGLVRKGHLVIAGDAECGILYRKANR